MFKNGEIIICVDITNKPFRGRKRKDVKFLTNGKVYTVLELNNPYNTGIPIINDNGLRHLYSPRRFKKVDRRKKLNKLTKIIYDRLG